MFKKLRNKFLILNIFMTSLVMIIAFIAIYVTTYNNIELKNESKLNSLASMDLSIQNSDNDLSSEDEKTIKSKEENIINIQKDTIYASYPLSFYIEVDEDGNIKDIQSSLDMSLEDYEKVAKEAWESKEENSKIKLNGIIWAYKIASKSNFVTESSKDKGFVNNYKETYEIVFLDVTESYNNLDELLVTFFIVGIITIVIFFVIALYFAELAIKPIKETWEKQRRFITDASHELKTPLTIIRSNSDVLFENKKEKIEDEIKWLNYIKIGTDRMSKLINDMLALSRMDNIDNKLRSSSFDINKVIEDIIQSMEARIIEKNICIKNLLSEELIIKGDLEKINQVIMILFDNAIKYTESDGWIKIFNIKSKGYIIFSIENSGKGIAKEDLPKVFDRFYRAESSRNSKDGGYGLGLSIAKAIIDSMNGNIFVKSRENESTIFTFKIKM